MSVRNLPPRPNDYLALHDAVTAEPSRTVNGLRMPPALFERVMAAIRGLFPALPAGLSDEATLQLLMRQVAIDWLATWEARQAAPDPSVAAQAAQRAASARRDSAAAAARAEAAAGIATTTDTVRAP